MLQRQDLNSEMRVLPSLFSCDLSHHRNFQDMDPEDDKLQQKEMEAKFKPLIEWLKQEAGDSVRNGDYIGCWSK
jgi:hypothetical protein